MKNLIYFKKDEFHKDLIEFVTGYRKRSWFRRSQITTSPYLTDGPMAFDTDGETEDAVNCILRSYPSASIYALPEDAFKEHIEKNAFFLIEQDIDGDKPLYYDGDDNWTADVQKADLWLSKDSADLCLGRQRQKGLKVVLRTVFVNAVNGLLEPMAMIVCVSKRAKKDSPGKFFVKKDGNRLRLAEKVSGGTRYPFDEAVRTFEELKKTNKNFYYAVVPAPKDNILCSELEAYMKKHKIGRSIAVSTKLEWLNGETTPARKG